MVFRKSSKGKQPGEWKMVLNHRFRIDLPPEWQETTIYTFQGPEENGVRHQILVTVETPPEPDDLEGYAALRIRTLTSALQAYQELKRGPIQLANGLPAYELVCRWAPLEDRTVYQRILYVIAGGNGYSLVATFSKKSWKTYGLQVDRILKSFRVSE